MRAAPALALQSAPRWEETPFLVASSAGASPTDRQGSRPCSSSATSRARPRTSAALQEKRRQGRATGGHCAAGLSWGQGGDRLEDAGYTAPAPGGDGRARTLRRSTLRRHESRRAAAPPSVRAARAAIGADHPTPGARAAEQTRWVGASQQRRSHSLLWSPLLTGSLEALLSSRLRSGLSSISIRRPGTAREASSLRTGS